MNKITIVLFSIILYSCLGTKILSTEEIRGFYFCFDEKYDRYIELKADETFIYGYKDVHENRLECYGKWELYKNEILLISDLPASGECIAIDSYPGNSWEVKLKNKTTLIIGPFKFKKKIL